MSRAMFVCDFHTIFWCAHYPWQANNVELHFICDFVRFRFDTIFFLRTEPPVCVQNKNTKIETDMYVGKNILFMFLPFIPVFFLSLICSSAVQLFCLQHFSRFSFHIHLPFRKYISFRSFAVLPVVMFCWGITFNWFENVQTLDLLPFD